MSVKTEEAVSREYKELADFYDDRWAFYVEATLSETLNRMDLLNSDMILDVACGTGTLLQRISILYPDAKLFGIDLSTEMLNVAKIRIGSAAEIYQGRADLLPFESDSFDTVVSTNAFHFFRQPEEALREMLRVLQPCGRLIITDWCDDFFACGICDRFLRVFNRAHHRIYGSNKCRLFVKKAGFENVEVDPYKVSWLWGMMTAKGSKPPCDRQLTQ